MAKKSHPRRGSLAYKPQKRVSRLHSGFGTVKDAGETKALGFVGYKAGMTRVLRIEDRKTSEAKGQEIADAVTVLECPPLRVYGARLYRQDLDGLSAYQDFLADDLHDELARTISLPEGSHDLADAEELVEDASEIRLLVHTQPYLTGIGKKKPEILELPLGGPVEEQFEHAQEKLGSELAVSEVFQDGQYLDAIGVTQGKGIQGAVKRHGVKPLGHKAQKVQRKAGNLGPWHPDHTSWRVPQAGQQGNVRRTEYNKRLLQIGEDTEKINPAGGFTGYGNVNNEYVLVKGSVPGPSKRLITLRSAIRKDKHPGKPQITYVDN